MSLSKSSAKRSKHEGSNEQEMLDVCNKSLKEYLRESMIVNSDDEEFDESMFINKDKGFENGGLIVEGENLKECLRKSLIISSENNDALSPLLSVCAGHTIDNAMMTTV